MIKNCKKKIRLQTLSQQTLSEPYTLELASFLFLLKNNSTITHLSPQGVVALGDVVVGALAHGVALREAALDVLVGGHQPVAHLAQLRRHRRHRCRYTTVHHE